MAEAAQASPRAPKAADTPLLDRTGDAAVLAGSLAKARGSVIVLYGKRGIGKTELIRGWLIPLLRLQQPVYYAECSPDLPSRLFSPEGEISVDWESVPPGYIFLDDFHRLVALPERVRRDAVRKLCAAARGGPDSATIAVVAVEENLRDIIALRDAAPAIAENLLEIPEISLAAGLQSLAATDPAGPLLLQAPVLAGLTEDLSRCRATGVSPELVRVIYSELKRNRTGPAQGLIGLADYRSAGGLRGLLEEYLARQMDEMEQAIGPQAAGMGSAILEDVALGGGSRAPVDVPEIAARLGVAESLVDRGVGWMRERNLLIGTSSDQLALELVQLFEIVEEQTNRRLQERRPAQRSLAAALRAWVELGSVLPKDRFEHLHAMATELRVSPQEAAFMAHCALRYAGDEPRDAAAYWIRRIRDRSEQVATLIRALSEPASPVRARATRLLREYNEPEVRGQLYRIALEDADPEVRRQALSSLEQLRPDEFRESLEAEADDPHNPYCQNAIEALRVFRDARSAHTLSALACDRKRPPEVRQQAIGSLAEIGIPESVDALVKLSLDAESENDATAAAQAIARIPLAPLQERALQRIRLTPVADDTRRAPLRLKSAVSTVAWLLLAVLLAIGNVVLNGLALLALRRYVLAALFFGVEVLIAGLGSVRNLDSSLEVSLILLNLCICQFVTLMAAAPGGRASSAPASLRSMLHRVMFVLNAFTVFLLFHGLAHLSVTRRRRALELFGAEVLSLLCFFIFVLYLELFTAQDILSNGMVSQMSRWIRLAMAVFYVGSGLLLFLGSYVWDIAGSARLTFRSRARILGDERRRKTYRIVLGNPEAASVVLSSLTSAAPAKARWARDLLRRFAPAIPSHLLVDYLARGGAGAPRAVLRALEHTKQEDSLRALRELWERSNARLRGRIERVLAARPSEASLRSLQGLLPAAGWTAHARYFLGGVNYRVRLWPRPLLMLGAWILPVALLLFYEGVATTRNKARPLIKSLGAAVLETGPAKMDLTRITETAQFLAKLYPDQSIEHLVAVYRFARRPDRLEFLPALSQSLALVAMGKSDHASKLALNALGQAVTEARNDHELLSASKALVRIVRDSSAQAVQDDARSHLALGARRFRKVLSSGSGPGAQRDALAALETGMAVAVLKEVVVAPLNPASATAETSESLRRVPKTRETVHAPMDEAALKFRALAALGRIATLKSSDALWEIETDPKVSLDLQGEARSQRQSMWQRRIDNAQSALDRGDYEQAIGICRSVNDLTKDVLTNPQRAQWSATFGKASYQLAATVPGTEGAAGMDEAIERLEAARQFGDRNAETAHFLAMSRTAKAKRLLDARNLNGAFEEARQAVAADPLYEEAYSIQGQAERLLSEPDRALQSFAKVAKISPANPWGYYMQGLILYEGQRYPAAAEMAVKAANADPAYRDTYALLRYIYTNQNHPEQAVQVLEGLSAKHPSVPYPLQELAILYHENLGPKDPHAFQRAYQIDLRLRGMAQDPAEKESYEANFIETSLTVGRYPEAVSMAGALAANAKSADNRIAMRLVAYTGCVLLGNYKEAARQLRELAGALHSLGSDPQDATTWIYDGTLTYVRQQAIPEPLKTDLGKLVAAINESNRKARHSTAPPDLIAANQAALRSAGKSRR